MDYATALLEQNRLLGDVVFAADLSTPVPTCPGWTLLQLLRHVGRGDRWAAQIIRDRGGQRTLTPSWCRTADHRPTPTVRRRLHEATVHRAEDLFLALVRRRIHQEPGIEIDGDMQVWHTWLARTPP